MGRRKCTNNLLVYELVVNETKPEAQIIGGEACEGEPVEVKIILIGRGPWDLHYTYGDGTDIVSLEGWVEDEYVVPVPMFPPGETLIWVMDVTDQCTVNSYETEAPPRGSIIIHPKPENTQIYPVTN